MKFGLEKPEYETWEGWEEWRKNAKTNHPIKYFLFETLPSYLKVKKKIYIEDPIYKFKSFFIYKEYMIDLRDGPGYDDLGHFSKYQGGYLSSSNKSIIALFKLAEEAVTGKEGTMPLEDRIKVTEEFLRTCSDEEKPYREKDLNGYKSILAAYKFFKEDLYVLHKEIDELYSIKDSLNYSKDIQRIYDEINDETEKHLIAIIKARKYLD